MNENHDPEICAGCSDLSRPRVITRAECAAGLRRASGADEPLPVDDSDKAARP